MLRLLIIAGLICMIDKTGFLCDERLKDLLYIRDEHEKEKTVEPSPEESKEQEVEEINKETKNTKKPKKTETVNVNPEELKAKSEPLTDFGDLSDFGDFSGFEFREPGSSSAKEDENSINKDAIFGDFTDEDELPLLDNLDDIAASILSDIYGGVY